jgi:hypothetical protein
MHVPASKKSENEFSRFSKEKLLYLLVNRTVIFFFLMCLLTLFLYAAGTFQGFMDSTQLSLLKLYETLGILLAVTSLCGTAIDFDRFIRIKKMRYLLRAGAYLFLVIFSGFTVLAVTVIIALSKGSGVK